MTSHCQHRFGNSVRPRKVMSRLCMVFALALLPKTVSATSRLQTFCTQKSGQWFNASQSCINLSSKKYSWDNGWDKCSSFVDTVNGSDTIKARLAHLISESERTTLLNMISSANIPGVYLGVGAFVSGSGNAADWNWCDTKACGRDGGQTKHPITIDMNGTTLGGAKKDCGGMNKNDPKIRSETCDSPPKYVACQYFMAQSQEIESTTGSLPQTMSTIGSLPQTMLTIGSPSPTTSHRRPPAHYVRQSSSPTRFVLHQYLNVSLPRQCAHHCYDFSGCVGYQFSANGTCTFLGAIDTSNTATMVDAFIDQLQ